MKESPLSVVPSLFPAVSSRLLGRLPDRCLDGRTLWINGEWHASKDGATFESISPSDGETLAYLAEANASDVDLAVKAAKKAALLWSALEPTERGVLLRRVAEQIRIQGEDLSYVEMLDSGRTITDTTNGVARAAAMFEYFGGMTDKIHGHGPLATPGRSTVVEREPYGVIAAIAPWNYPLSNAVTKLAPILACGNTIVLKPAEQTPLVTLLLAEIIKKAGIPDGVVNIITGGGTTGAELVKHPSVAKVSFTGSTDTGRLIAAEAGKLLKGVVLELGGKSPMIVFEDADLNRAAAAAVFSTFMNQGQTCTSCNRVLVAKSVQQQFTRLCEEKFSELRIGDPFDPSSQVGAIVSREQRDRIKSLVQGVTSRSLKLENYNPTQAGFFIPPMIVDKFEYDSSFAREEIFGPVMAIRPFANDEDVYSLANDTNYGLAASVWTNSLSRAEEARRRIEAGMIWINCVHALPPGAPLSGHKASGLGSEYGLEVSEQYMKIKTTVTMTSGWQSPFEAVRQDV